MQHKKISITASAAIFSIIRRILLHRLSELKYFNIYTQNAKTVKSKLNFFIEISDV